MSFEQKSSLVQSLGNYANSKINDAMQLVGKSLPCSVVSVQGSIVTVKFELTNIPFNIPQVTIPVFGPEYIRYPIQVGDKGFCVAADASLRAMTGLGIGTADLTQMPSLTALVFYPIGNKNWSPVDGNALVMYGPNGCVIRDSGSGCVITLTPFGVTTVVGDTTISVVGNSVTVTSPDVVINGNLTVHGQITGDQGFNISGGTTTANITGNVNIVGTLTNNSKNVGSTHTHSGVQPGSGNTGAPN